MRWRDMVLAAWMLGMGCGDSLRAAEQGAPPEEDWLLLAQQAQAKGLVLKAVELAGKATEARPKDPRVWYYRASLLQKAGRIDGAEADLSKAISLKPEEPALYLERGTVRLRLAKYAESIADYDRCVELRPSKLPELWQRGIALYYARRFADGRRQFEVHRTVNPGDVENSAWHFACVARVEGFERAREQWLPTEGDSRIPMTEIQEMFVGKRSPEDVLAAAEKLAPGGNRDAAVFYARLYMALYEEARGKRDVAARHVAEATKFADSFGIMGDVARLHADWLAGEIRRTAP